MHDFEPSAEEHVLSMYDDARIGNVCTNPTQANWAGKNLGIIAGASRNSQYINYFVVYDVDETPTDSSACGLNLDPASSNVNLVLPHALSPMCENNVAGSKSYSSRLV